MRAFKVMREVKYCTAQLLLQVVSNFVSPVSWEVYDQNRKVLFLIFNLLMASNTSDLNLVV